jgi:hypothetical protein
LPTNLKENWIDIKTKILKRKYKPQPVLRVEIPKPNGGVRNLGIPTVADRIIEQAITQALTPMFGGLVGVLIFKIRNYTKLYKICIH